MLRVSVLCTVLTVVCHVRLLEVMTNRIVDIFPLDKPVGELFPQRMYRVEVRLVDFNFKEVYAYRHTVLL